MKNTEPDKLHNIIIDLALELKSFIKEQRGFNEMFLAKLADHENRLETLEFRMNKLVRQLMKANLQLKQLNLSVMKISEKLDGFDQHEVRIVRMEKKLKLG